jgi:precorrin-2 dehydrogenase/sirohydrochlorin ferrochelatase
MRRPGLVVSLYVDGKRCVVVGEGELAEERVQRLHDAGAIVDLVASTAYAPEVCHGAFLVLGCVPALAERVIADARAAGAVAYTLDDPARSDFALPALVRRGSLSIAVLTDGVAPALARRLREELARVIGAAGAALDAFVSELEARRAALPPGAERKAALARESERLRLAGLLVVDPPQGGEPGTTKD